MREGVLLLGGKFTDAKETGKREKYFLFSTRGVNNGLESIYSCDFVWIRGDASFPALMPEMEAGQRAEQEYRADRRSRGRERKMLQELT